MATLKLQLAKINKAHRAQLERAASVKTQLYEEIQKLREAADIAEKKAALAQEAARQFQSRIDAWKAEFKKVQENMHGEFLLRNIFLNFSELTFPFFFELLIAAAPSCSKHPRIHYPCFYCSGHVSARPKRTSACYHG